MLPELHLDDWRATKDTLHLYCQIVGKMRMAITPPRNHWWHVTLYVDSRGLTTRRMHHRGDDVRGALGLRRPRAGGRDRRRPPRRLRAAGRACRLGVRPRAPSHAAELGLDVEIGKPFGVPMTTPFAEDSEHASWDRDAIERFARILDWSDAVLDEFGGWFCGKTSPVQVFWHGLDLAMSRYSGRPAPPIEADPVTQEAYSREVIAFGFWAGDDNLGEPPATRTPRPSRRACATSRCRGHVGRVRLGLAGGPAVRGGPRRRRPPQGAARLLPERLRGGLPPRRLGHRRTRVGLVPDAR